MQPNDTWRALMVAAGFLLTLGCAVPVTYQPALHGTQVSGPLGLVYFAGMLLGWGIMAAGFTWPAALGLLRRSPQPAGDDDPDA